MADPVKLKARLTALKGIRGVHENTWRECLDYCAPELSSGFNGQTPLTAGEIQNDKAKLLDSTAQDSLQTSADGFMGGLTPANSRWFGMSIGTETMGEQQWLDEGSTTIFENIHAANFDAEGYDALLYLIAAGWFVLYADEADEGGYNFENWPIAQCYITATRKGGKIDTIYRECEVSANELVDEYGKEGVSETVAKMVESGRGDDRVVICWAIEPRKDYTPGATLAKRLPWASYKFEVNTNHLLSESGYHEFPCAVPRWRRLPGSHYAIGPMSNALADIKTVNEIKKWNFAAAETAIAPPMKAKDDGVLNPRAIKLGPRKVIVVNEMDSIEPLITGARIDLGQLVIADVQNDIRRALMADLFSKLLDDPRMTATQVHAIVGLLRQRMGPRFGRLQSEYLQPLVERCFGIALRAGVLGQPPPSLLNRNYTVKYLSPLARAQQIEDVSAMDRHEGAMLAEAQGGVPTVLDTYDWDEAQRHRAKLLGVPLRLVPDPKQVAAKREERAKARQQAQQQEVQMAAQAKGAEVMATNMAGA
jgi:hypothetical protein